MIGYNAATVSRRLKSFTLLIALVALAGAAAAAWYTPRYYQPELTRAWPVRDADWAASNSCRSCHPDQYRSWHRTFHRTMTQEATPESVRGQFDGQPVTYWGVTIRPYRSDGGYFFDYIDPQTERRLETREIVRTVGSRRYQQYLSRTDDGAYHRLEMLWHIEDQRWVHMNGVFLGHDNNPFDSNAAVWNTGCIMCHNTGPVPGVSNWEQISQGIISGETPMGGAGPAFEYESSVVELGIACGSCHGPGSVHAKRNRNPFRRYLLHFTGDPDPTIINPERLDKRRSADVCGQCHGQRLPLTQSMVVNWTKTGPTYRAGDTLDEHVDVVFRDTDPLYANHPEDLFTLRFWSDGTPRLTAYELQGLRQSACYQEGDLTCIDCHTMHDGDVRGQLPPEHRTARACESCHADIVSDISMHTRHLADSSGSNCYSCHMPKMVYGIMEIHRSHHIEIPDPAHDAANARPNACTSCHVDRSLAWAGQRSQDLWGKPFTVPTQRGDGADVEIADIVASLLGGDPVQRAVAARLAGRSDTPLAAEERAFLIPHLLTAMKRDRYPAVRRFSKKSLVSIAAALAAPGPDSQLGDGLDLGMDAKLAEYDFIAPAQARALVIADLETLWAEAPKQGLPAPTDAMLLDSSYQPLREPVEALLAQAAARSQEVNIGE